MTNPNDPAFTQQHKKADPNLNYGLTKREYFAAMAMSGWMEGVPEFDDAERGMKFCIKVADALIAELNKNGTTNWKEPKS